MQGSGAIGHCYPSSIFDVFIRNEMYTSNRTYTHINIFSKHEHL